MSDSSGPFISRTTGRHAAIQIASTLCYLECVFCMLSGIVLGVPVIKGGGSIPLVFLYLLAISILYGIAGFVLRKQLRKGAMFVVALIVARLATVAAGNGPYINLWVIVDVGILLLLRLNWQHLRDGSPTVPSAA